MHLRYIAVGLSALVLLSTVAHARSLPNLYTATEQRASFDGCADLFPAAKPINTATVPAGMRPLALCSDNFAVLYSQTSKTPLVVVERLNAAQLQDAKGEERTNLFYPDPRIQRPMDYDAFVKSTGLKLLGNLPVSGSVGRT
ncbi:DNA/RNA non-specific endonuclease [Pseudomonas sp. LY-1]|uniref:DNA/RNA non-specific endonuclease n=1 Tax=Pseudomonas veronii TaxID=76761 RepID=A0ABS0VLR7_PSEVE|nr:DNA/RNA non-specific endonuclease [Pseudomonas veronii]MBI6552917.1 DNA/RNA non-specific endonuclease [Pseudomonas veronii]MBI6651086.1 DNA/RNA non-specific endonuclease [Pseudomonas veronii]